MGLLDGTQNFFPKGVSPHRRYVQCSVQVSKGSSTFEFIYILFFREAGALLNESQALDLCVGKALKDIYAVESPSFFVIKIKLKAINY